MYGKLLPFAYACIYLLKSAPPLLQHFFMFSAIVGLPSLDKRSPRHKILSKYTHLRATFAWCHGITHSTSMNNLQVSLALDPRYFALRWFTTLLSREFDLPDTIRLWDSLFAAQDRTTFLVFVCVTLLLAQRETLLAGDFASNLQLLQAYPPTDVPQLLARSEALRICSARGGEASAGDSREQGSREAAEGARAAAEQVNVVARKLWNAATDLAVGAAERMSSINEGPDGYQGNFYWGDGGIVGKADAGGGRG